MLFSRVPFPISAATWKLLSYQLWNSGQKGNKDLALVFSKQTFVAEKTSWETPQGSSWWKVIDLAHSTPDLTKTSEPERGGRRGPIGLGQGAQGTGSPFRLFLTGFFHSWLFPFYSVFCHICVCSAVSQSSDGNMVMMMIYVCMCLHTHVCVYQLLMPFSNCLTYSFFEYLLTAYYVPVMVLCTGARAVNKQTEILDSCLHRLYIQIGRGSAGRTYK